MKFQQRIAMLSSAGGITIVYLLLVYSQGVEQVWNNHPLARQRRSLFVDYEFEQQFWSPSVKQFHCEEQEAIPGQYQNNETIFTIDLPKKTNFHVNSNKQYKLPHSPVENEIKDRINVIILPHSHVDAGWLRTIEEYYVYHVKSILNNMVKKLSRYENMTFVWAETVFLSMWWNELDDDVKLIVQNLIERGQLEIALGGWVMSDEASTHYVSVIDQLSEGHQWVLENLHTKPVNSWSIDPFGHSGTMPYLWKQAGMENMVIQRVHQAIKATLANQKSLEFNWRQYWDKTGSDDILCHVMPYLYYGIPYTCGPDKPVCAMYDFGKPKALNEKPTGKLVTAKNIEKQAQHLQKQYRLKAGLFRYKTILVPLGDDFRFDNSEEWDLHYNNYKMLMEYINGRKDWNIEIQFGTLKDYFKLIREEEKIMSEDDKTNKFPVLQGDFFPYSDLNSEYWTGYYSTRPFDKQLSRDLESSLRAADVLQSLAHANCKAWDVFACDNQHDSLTMLQEARRSLGLFLHHDAITGTAKPLVMQDYEHKLLTAYNMTQQVIESVVQVLLTRGRFTPDVLSTEIVRRDERTPPLKYKMVVHNHSIKVVFFNPLAQERTEFVRIVVSSVNIEIKNSENVHIPFQINPVFKSTTKILSSEYEIVFHIEMSPFALETYTLSAVERTKFGYWSSITTRNCAEVKLSENQQFHYSSDERATKDIQIENEFMRASFNDKGMLSKIFDKRLSKSSSVKLDFMSYISDGSGAYLFYPSGEAESTLKDVPVIQVVKGPYMEKMNVIYKHLSHSVTLYDTPSAQGQGLHIENELDLKVDNMVDKEVIMRVNSDVKNKHNAFYTDQNGYQLIGRQTNLHRRIETNYYPITNMVLLEDDTRRLTIHAGQSHGAASLAKGQLEVMLDRQVSTDDRKGLGEGVTDNKLTLSRFIVQLEHKERNIPVKNIKFTSPSLASNIINEHLQQPIVALFTNVNSQVFDKSFHPINQSLPCDVSLVSFKNLVNSDLMYKGTSVILHRKAYSCNFPVIGLQCSVNDRFVNLRSLFSNISIQNSQEMTLTHLSTKNYHPADRDIEIKPMEIKSFLLSV